MESAAPLAGLVCKVFTGGDKQAKAFLERYVEVEFGFLQRLLEISASKSVQSNKIEKIVESRADLIDIYFFGSKWIQELSRLSCEFGFTLPSFANYKKYAANEQYRRALKGTDFGPAVSDQAVAQSAALYKDFCLALGLAAEKPAKLSHEI